MSSGLYSGVSGLALGVGLYKGVGGLWGGASGLIDGFGGGGFSPATLFAAGEPGGWYDPSDLSTMFQDSAGTTPVTATGQTVGLVLDKSQGLVLGPELVTNGDFSNGSTGWTLLSSTVVNSALVCSSVTSLNFAVRSITVTAGRTYLVSFTVADYVSGGLFLTLGVGTNVSTPTFSGNGVWTARLIAGAGNSEVRMGCPGGGFVGTIDNISVKELAGNHLTQTTAASRPQYQIDGNGLPYLLFDGTDDGMVSPTITPGIDKAQVFAGVRKLSDATAGIIVESSTNVDGFAGTIILFTNTNTYGAKLRGTNSPSAIIAPTVYAPPVTSVLTATGDIAADINILRINGAQVASSSADLGTGNYLAYPLYVGRRGGTSLPFNGRLYQLIVRFGANLPAATITATETFVNSKTGAY